MPWTKRSNTEGSRSGRELQGIRQEVRDDLLDTRLIGLDPDGLRLDGDGVVREPSRALERLEAPLDGLGHVDLGGHELDLSKSTARDVDEISDEPHQLLGLVGDHVARAAGVLGRRRLTEHRDRGGDGAQRIAQLVAEHREELILRVARRLGFRAGDACARQLEQVGNDEAEALDALGDERADGEERGNRAAFDGQQMSLVLAASSAQCLAQRRPIGLCDEAADRPADDRLGARSDQLGEPSIAVQDVARRGQRERALLHLLDEHPVGLLGVLEREELRAMRAIDDERVDLALANGAQGLLGFLELTLELLDPFEIHRVVGHARCHHVCSTRSSPAITRALLDMSPMTRRAGNGNCLTQVGAAMMCSPLASIGCS